MSRYFCAGLVAFILALAMICMNGCTPLISNNIQLGCGQDKVSQSVKGESDMTNTPKTDVSVPVSLK